MLICVTGKMGSGKTTFLNFIANQGYKVFEADAYIREIYKKDGIGYNKIIETFGKEFVNETEVDRKKIGKLVFNNPQELDKLNKAILPLIINWIKEIKKNNDEAIVELAIYFNYIDKFEDLFDKIVLIKGKKEIEDKKVIEKDWDNKQNPIIDPINQDYIEIINNDSIQKLEENAQYFIDTFLSKNK